MPECRRRNCVTDAILAIKPDALFIGITTDRFWGMTYVEVVDEIKAFNRRRENNYMERARFRATFDYQLAQLIGTAFNEPKKYPRTLKKAYPDLFKDQRISWQDHKERFAEFAEFHNRQAGGGKG